MTTDHMNDFDPETNYLGINSMHTSSEYISIENYLSLNNNDGLTIFNYNIRSLNSNLDTFISTFSNSNLPDIFVLTETWMNDFDNINIPGYNAYHTIRTWGRSGGVSIFVRSDFMSKNIVDFSYSNTSIEICTVEIKSNNHSIIIIGVYRPHCDHFDNFSSSIYSILNNDKFRNKEILLMGDFNINFLGVDSLVNDFMDNINTYHFVPVISKPTRFAPNNSNTCSLLDQIFLNRITSYNCGIILNDLTDHLPTFIKIPFRVNNSSTNLVRIHFRENNQNLRENFHEKLNNYDWSLIENSNVDLYTENFLINLNRLYCKCFPLKSKLVSAHKLNNPWYTPRIKQLIEAKSKYFSLHRLGLVSNSENNSFKNKVKSIITKTKLNYYKNIFIRNKNDMRKTWDLINSLTARRANIQVKNLLFNNIEFPNDLAVAEMFNEYFCSIATNLDENLSENNLSPYTYVRNNNNTSIFLSPVTREECSEIICHLKRTKQDINHIPVNLFISMHYHFIDVICKIINLGFSKGQFPNVLKIATVVPIFKKGDRTNTANYRPIALLPFLSKVFERCIFNRITEFISKNNIITSCQFGFSKCKSTVDAINLVMDLV